MIRYPGRRGALGQRFQLTKVIDANWIGGTNRHRDSMHHQRIMLFDLIEDLERASSWDHEVLRKNLKPIDFRMSLDDMDVVIPAQTYTKSEKWKITTLHDYANAFFSASKVASLAASSVPGRRH